MVEFTNGRDVRCRAATLQVAKFWAGPRDLRYCVIGTGYGFWVTSAGDVRTWRTYSGARKALKRYVEI